jgi:predicted MFS family arabinose efflux permease
VLGLTVMQRDKLATQVVRHDPLEHKEHDLAFMKLPVVWMCFAFFVFSTMTMAVMQNFSVSILTSMVGASFEAATYTLTAYMLSGALGMLVGGIVAAHIDNSDKVVATAMAAGAILLALCGTGVLAALPTMVVLAVTGFSIGIGGPSRDMMIKKATPKGATGRVYGLVYSGLDTGLALGPLIFGVFMDRGWYGATLLGAAAVLMLSVLAALGVGKRMVAS